MARSHARIQVSIWRNDGFVALTAEAQRVFMLIVSQPTLTWAGVTAYTPKRWASMARNTKPAAIVRAVGELAEHRFVVVDEETEEVWVRTFVRHNGVPDQPNVKKAMHDDLDAVASDAIRDAFAAEYPELMENPSGNPFGKGCRNPSGKGSPNPSPGPAEKERKLGREEISPSPTTAAAAAPSPPPADASTAAAAFTAAGRNGHRAAAAADEPVPIYATLDPGEPR